MFRGLGFRGSSSALLESMCERGRTKTCKEHVTMTEVHVLTEGLQGKQEGARSQEIDATVPASLPPPQRLQYPLITLNYSRISNLKYIP